MTNDDKPLKVRHRPAVQHELPVLVKWIEGRPPPVNPNRFFSSYNHALIAEQLREQPGVWAELEGLPETQANRINRGETSAYRPGGMFQAVSRDGVVYARFVGGIDLKAEFIAELEEALSELDGTPESSVRVLTGLTRDELASYGGVSEEDR